MRLPDPVFTKEIRDAYETIARFQARTGNSVGSLILRTPEGKAAVTISIALGEAKATSLFEATRRLGDLAGFHVFRFNQSGGEANGPSA